MGAGFTVITVFNPVWVIKTRMQLQLIHGDQKQYKNVFDCIAKIYAEGGLKYFYRGMAASYIGISEGTLQFIIYERLKEFLRNQGAAENQQGKLSVPLYLLSASSAKLLASALTYPHEVIRTRMREPNTNYTGVIHCLRTVYKTEGFAALYGGLAPHLLRVVPNTAIMFATFEIVSGFLKNRIVSFADN